IADQRGMGRIALRLRLQPDAGNRPGRKTRDGLGAGELSEPLRTARGYGFALFRMHRGRRFELRRRTAVSVGGTRHVDDRSAIFLTGATGLVGGLLLRRL